MNDAVPPRTAIEGVRVPLERDLFLRALAVTELERDQVAEDPVDLRGSIAID